MSNRRTSTLIQLLNSSRKRGAGGGGRLRKRLGVAIAPCLSYGASVSLGADVTTRPSRPVHADEAARTLRSRWTNIAPRSSDELARDSLGSFWSRGPSGAVDTVASVAAGSAGRACGAWAAGQTAGARDYL